MRAREAKVGGRVAMKANGKYLGEITKITNSGTVLHLNTGQKIPVYEVVPADPSAGVPAVVK